MQQQQKIRSLFGENVQVQSVLCKRAYVSNNTHSNVFKYHMPICW